MKLSAPTLLFFISITAHLARAYEVQQSYTGPRFEIPLRQIGRQKKNKVTVAEQVDAGKALQYAIKTNNLPLTREIGQQGGIGLITHEGQVEAHYDAKLLLERHNIKSSLTHMFAGAVLGSLIATIVHASGSHSQTKIAHHKSLLCGSTCGAALGFLVDLRSRNRAKSIAKILSK